jgi:hypothetical protein
LNRKTKLNKELFFNEEWNLEKIKNINKISFTSDEKELDILVNRLIKVYNDCY